MKKDREKSKRFADLAKKRASSLTSARRSEIAKMGNKARNEAMTDEERSLQASKAATKRWDEWRKLNRKKKT